VNAVVVAEGFGQDAAAAPLTAVMSAGGVSGWGEGPPERTASTEPRLGGIGGGVDRRCSAGANRQ